MSNITIYRFALDMTPGGVTPVVHLSQYDEAFQLEFTLYSRSGELDIPSGATAMIEGTKLDGKAYSANATISENVVTVAGDVQISAVAGNNPFQIVLKSGNSTVGSANFTISVERAAMDYDTVSDSKLAQIQDVTATAAQLTAAAENVTDGVETFEALAESVSDMLADITDDTLSITDKAADAAAVGNALAAEIAPKYSTSATYAVGDYVIYNNALYRCNTAIATAESWTAAHWTAVKVGSELSNLKSDITEPTKNIADSTLGRFYVKNDGSIAESSQNYFGMKSIVPCTAGTNYYIKFYGVSSESTLQTNVAYYDSSKALIEIVKVANSDHATFTTPATCGYLSAFIYASGGVTISSQAALQIEIGTTATDYTPPLCAVDVDARSEIDDLKSNVNAFNDTITEPTKNIADSPLGRFYVESNGSVSASNQNYFGMKSIVPCTAGTNYYIKFYGVSSESTLQTNVAYYDSSKALIEIVKVANSDHATFTTPATCRYLSAFIYASGGVTISSQAALQIELGSNPTGYVPPRSAVDVEARKTINPVSKLNNRGYYGTPLYDNSNMPFEYGNISLVSGQTVYTESFSRIRTPQGSEIYLKKGDFITQKDTSISRFYVIYKDESGVLHSSGTIQNPYYVTESGYYSLIVRLEPEVEQSDLLDTLAGNIVIYNNGSSETENVLFRPRKTRTVAHGSGGTTNMVVPGGDPVPENSISGLIAAAKAGYWGVEFDARITKDGEWISCHDDTLDRTTNGTGNVVDYTLAELKQLYVKKKIDGVYTLTNEHPASVDDLLDASVIYGLVPIIDLKWDANLVTSDVVKALAQKLVDRHIEKYSIVSCSSINPLVWIKEVSRAILTYRQLTSAVVTPLNSLQMEYARYGNVGVSVSQDLDVFTKEWTKTMQSYGYSIAAWTSYPTTRERTKEVLDYGVDCYFSEQLPDVLTLKYDE